MTADGTVEARARDAAGNYSNTASYSVSNIDKTAPNAPTLYPSTTSPTSGTVSVTISYPGDSYLKEYRINGGVWQLYLSPIVMSTNETVEARSKDEAGRIG